MTNKNIKRMFLFLTLLVLLVGVVSATEVANNETSTTTQVQTATPTQEVNTPSTTQIEDTTSDIQATDNTDSNVEINKKSTPNTKTGTTYKTTVSNYDQLVNKVEEAKDLDGDEIIINLKKGNYYATQSIITWGNTYEATTLTINGNGSTIYGRDSYAFMSVYSGYNLVIKNATFKNFYKDGWGSVFYVNKGANLKVYYSTFKDNYVTENGGVIDNYGVTTVDTCLFDNNAAGPDGGCICNSGTLYVYDSIFNEGSSTSSGGAIANFNNAYVYDSFFFSNSAKGGGALYCHNNGAYLYVSGCFFNDNYGSSNGGAISTWGATKVVNSLFDDNEAYEGAGISIEDGSAYIYKNTFVDNYAKYGSAINQDDGDSEVLYNTFQRNIAYYTGYTGSITYVKNYGTLVYSGNTYSLYTLTKYQDTIYIGSSAYMSLKNNDFDDREDTYVSINNMTATTFGSTVTIKGKVETDDAYIVDATVTLYVNGVKKSSTTTTEGGVYSFKYKANKVGTNNITVKYAGSYYRLPDSTTKTLTVNKDQLKVTISAISQKTYKDDVKITGKFTNSKGDPIGNTVLKVNVNGKTYNVKTSTSGVYTKTVKANKVGTNNITVSYAGNKNFLGVTAKKTFTTVARATKITVNSVSQKTYKDSFTVSGRFTDNKGNAIGNTIVKINLNGKVYNVKTDSDGYFTKELTAKKVGSNTLNVSYAGNTNYKAASVKKTFTTVARPTKITLFGLSSAYLGSTITISGMFTDTTGNPISNTIVKMNINGKTYNVKTDSTGVFEKNYKTTQVGSNSLTVYYPGNTNYKSTTVTKYFTVTR
ncbi:MAG: hypothetical protein BZ138_05750 [Methanosphaera sp. rholeuAM270]|nr:MAG: hypothetical protein BZ138_05750 [Methanosphaera sp. rholeuAM270]